MKKYLGEFEITEDNNPYAKYTPLDWVEKFISRYGGFDGSHHKAWVLDQCLRICKGTSLTVKEARWENELGEIVETEYRFWLNDPSEEYTKLVDTWREVYGHDEGIAP